MEADIDPAAPTLEKNEPRPEQGKGHKPKSKQGQGQNKKKGKKGSSRSIETLYRSAYRTQLELTGIADAKANIMISVNGLIITGIIATTGLFISYGGLFKYLPLLVLLISVASMIFAVLAAKPKLTNTGADAKAIHAGEASLLYFANFKAVTEEEYATGLSRLIEDTDTIYTEMAKHIYNLGAVLTRKYRYLQYSYSIFLYGMIAISLLFTSMFVNQSIASARTLDKVDTTPFTSIHEPSGLVHLGSDEFLIVEDEPERPVHRVRLTTDGQLQEMGRVEILNGDLNPPLILNDLEGITYDGTYVYVVTSHSQNKAGNAGEGRMVLVRYKYESGILHSPQQIKNLKDVVVAHLRPYMSTLTTEQIWRKINIEGLSWSPKTEFLSVAFRGPLVFEKSLVLHLADLDNYFEQQTAIGMPMQFSWLDLANQGIRSLSWDDDLNGYFIATGRKGVGHELWKWFGEVDSPAVKVTTEAQPLPQGTEGISSFQFNGRKSMLMVIDDGNEELGLPGHYKLIRLNLEKQSNS